MVIGIWIAFVAMALGVVYEGAASAAIKVSDFPQTMLIDYVRITQP